MNSRYQIVPDDSNERAVAQGFRLVHSRDR